MNRSSEYRTGSNGGNENGDLAAGWWAKRKNLSLNDRGFFREQGKPETRVRGDFREEADVFRWLKLAYVAPADRSV